MTATVLVLTAVGGAYVASTLAGSDVRYVSPAARIPAATPAVSGPPARALVPVVIQNRPAGPAKPPSRRTPKATPASAAPRTQARSAVAGQPGVTTARPSSHDGASDDPSRQPGDDGTGHDD